MKIVEFRATEMEERTLPLEEINQLPDYVTKDWKTVPMFELTSKNNYLGVKRSNGKIELYKIIGKGDYPEYEDKFGFVYDNGSIPTFLPRRFIPPIGNAGISMAYKKHDGDFASHENSFKQTNKDLRDMVKIAGMNWFKAKLIYLAVSSPIGKKRYNENSEESIKWHMDRFKLVRTVDKWPLVLSGKGVDIWQQK